MKNRINYFVAALAMAAIVIGCVKLDNTPQFPASTVSFSITPDKTAVAAPVTDSANVVLTFTWNDPKFATGLSTSKYTLMADSAGKNFVKFVNKTYTGVLTGALLGKELNQMALKAGGKIGQPMSLEVKVVASQANNDQPKTSNVVVITVTPYGDLTLNATSKSPKVIVCTAATATQVGDTLSWNQAFNGYIGVKLYSLEFAKGGTNFASITSTSVTTFSKTYTKRELNQMAQSVGVAANTTGNVDFRIKATNESGTVLYSNTVTLSISTYVAFNSIGLIGDFTGWGSDVDMYRPDAINAPADWTVTLYITGGGGVKFRADDAWSDNWGNSAFPSGTGAAGGANIPVTTAGYYTVNFNTVTYAYSFTALAPSTYTFISLIGDFNGWGADVDLTVDGTGHIWTGTLSLASASGLKIRANHAWTTAWGGITFPAGYSSTSGGNISAAAGNYFVYFNDVSGEVFFGNTGNNAGAGTPYGKIGAIGDFNGWGADALLIKNPANPYKWSAKVVFPSTGGVKLRADQAWTTSWGGATFPSGQGTTQSDPNIAVAAGTYQINFNSATGQYTFEQ